MSRIKLSIPSPAMVISVVALSIAIGGTGYAASTVVSPGATTAKKKKPSESTTDKKLIKGLAPTLTVKAAKSATNATNAQNAQNAVNATNATNAQNAVNAGTANNANNLGGQPASAFVSNGNHASSGGVIKLGGTTGGNTQTVLTKGPFTLTLTCTKDAAGNVKESFDASSSEDKSVINGHVVTPAGTKQNLDTLGGAGGSTTFSNNNDVNYDFEAPSGFGFLFISSDGINSLGTDCWLNFS
jgi:hypothetical protein